MIYGEFEVHKSSPTRSLQAAWLDPSKVKGRSCVTNHC